MMPMNGNAFITAMFTSAILFSLIASAPVDFVHAESVSPPTIAWQNVYGAGDLNNSVFYTKAASLIQTRDEGYAIAGCYNYSILLGNIDASGNMAWNRTYGVGSAVAVVQADGGGFALACDVNLSVVLIKTDSEGNMLWNQTFADSSPQQADWVPTSMVKASDGGYAIAGYAPNQNSLLQNQDFLMIKTDSQGRLEWVKTFGGAGDDEAASIIQAGDGGYALAGSTSSFGPYNNNFWLVKTDAAGNLQWAKAYGKEGLGHKVSGDSYGLGDNRGYSVVQTVDDGYALVGYTGSTDGNRAWLLKTDANGEAQWNQTYSTGASSTTAYSVVQTGNGGYAVAATNRIIKTDNLGQIQWNQTYQNANTAPTYPQTGDVQPCTIIQTQDGGLAILGTANPNYAGMVPSPCFYLLKTASFLPPQTAPSSSTSAGVETHLAFPSITIHVDGSVSPSSAPIKCSGNVYTFTENYSGSLTVLKSGIMIDGAGFTLQGNGSILESDGSSTFIQFTEAGIQLNNADNVEIKNLKLVGYAALILFDGSCSHNSVHDNVLLGELGTGILARNNFEDNTLASNNFTILEYAISIEDSQNNLISGNVITKQSSGGITLNSGSNNTVSQNLICDCSWESIRFGGSSSGNRIVNNTITGTSTAIYGAKASVIAQNNLTRNGYAIAQAENCTISENIIKDNDIGIQGSDTYNNSIYLNNFVNNTLQAGYLVYKEGRAPLQANTWQNWYNWSQGNYWSDYNGADADGNGIGDTPYIVDVNNRDYAPLVPLLNILVALPGLSTYTSQQPTSPSTLTSAVMPTDESAPPPSAGANSTSALTNFPYYVIVLVFLVAILMVAAVVKIKIAKAKPETQAAS